MNRVVWTVAVCAMLATGPALAASCPAGAGDKLRLDDWTLVSTSPSVEIEISYTNVSGKGVRMAEGAVFFFDTLGRFVGSVPVDPDADIGPGAQVAVRNKALGMERVGEMSRDEFDPVLCVLGLGYEDGETERF